MTDENLLSAAKIRELTRDNLDGGDRLLSHVAYSDDVDDIASLNFLKTEGLLADTELESVLFSSFETEIASTAVHADDSTVMSYLSGITERDLSASFVRIPAALVSQIENYDAPAFVSLFGNPNAGKTNMMLLLVEISRSLYADLRIVSNIDAEFTDSYVVSAEQLLRDLLNHREEPKVVIIDEASTHFDARTYSREIALQWSPVAKRMAKLNVEACGLIVHTGKDLHPEAKRLTTLAIEKVDKKTARLYDNWNGDADTPFDDDMLFGADLSDVEPTGLQYDADDSSPWNWNLDAELFAGSVDWNELADNL